MDAGNTLAGLLWKGPKNSQVNSDRSEGTSLLFLN